MNLMPDDRRDRIVEELRADGMLRATDLAERLGVTPVTIRRDIKQLTDEGVLRRVHGGATLNDDQREPAAVASPGTSARVNGHTVGILVPTLDYYWPDVIQGAKAEAEARGARLILRGTSYESTDDRVQITRLLNAGADGLILAPDVQRTETHAMLDWLAAAEVPVVLAEREAQLHNLELIEAVNTDHTAGARAAVHHLAELGHRRVGFMGSSRSPHLLDIREGWDAAVSSLSLTTGLNFDLVFDPTDSSGDLRVIEDAYLQAQAQRVTALLVHADREAMALAQLAQRGGVQVPGGLSIVAYDDEVAELFTPSLTAVRPPRASIGKAAVQLLLERLRDPERPAHRVTVAPRLKVRESSGPIA